MGYWLLLLVTIAAGAWGLRRYNQRTRRRARRLAPLSTDRVAIIACNVPLYRRLPTKLKRELEGHVNVFIDEKTFVGCGGLEVTDKMRVTIAAHACMLLLNRSTEYFPNLKTILLYPDAYVTDEVIVDGPVEIMEEVTNSGESWQRGPVVLSWNDVLSAATEGKNDNVVLHEFAHQLDQENELADGAPVLEDESGYAEWAQVLGREYKLLQTRLDRGEETLIDPYAAESPAEFFAVVTEAFFENGASLRAQHPELYRQVSNFYKVDPANWEGQATFALRK